jgi:hypothetical protein
MSMCQSGALRTNPSGNRDLMEGDRGVEVLEWCVCGYGSTHKGWN